MKPISNYLALAGLVSVIVVSGCKKESNNGSEQIYPSIEYSTEIEYKYGTIYQAKYKFA